MIRLTRETRGIRGLARRGLSIAAVTAVAGLSLATTSCGGSSAGAAKPMVLIEFLFVNRALQPSFPTGTPQLPRNAETIFQFSELVNPSSVDEQTIQIRFGASFQSVPKGSFSVDGSRVIYDPTVTKTGQPNPFGLDSLTQYSIELPAVGQANAVVENLDHDPLLSPFFSNFVTGSGYLRELVPPTITSVFFIPAADPVSKNIPGNGLLALKFSEAMDPSSFILSVTTPAPLVTDSLDIRYTPTSAINIANGLASVPLAGTFTNNAAADTYYFKPTFSFGNKKYQFFVAVFQGLKDLAGNLLVNPGSYGPFTCDGLGIATGRTLTESFDTTTDNDGSKTTADWGFTEQGFLNGAPITTRRQFITSYQQFNHAAVSPNTSNQTGGYYIIVDPLQGKAFNTTPGAPIPVVPTALGRRVMWAFSDLEMGGPGTVTTCSWGPDSNATYAAKYPKIIMRMGFQKTNSQTLGPSFSGNYLGQPLILYQGSYSVSQKANVGDEALALQGTAPNIPNTVGRAGYVNWPAPVAYFDWDPNDPTVNYDSILLFDASVQEGDTFQQLRGWFGLANGGVSLIGGYPARRLYAEYEGDQANPQTNLLAPGGAIVNPEPSVTDTAFTLTRRISIAQTQFYTPPATDPAGNAYPVPRSTQNTFGVKSDYLPAQVTPSIQAGGASYIMEFQGAQSLELNSRVNVNIVAPFTPFTTDINDCDTYPYLRWRMTMISNLVSNKTARVGSVVVPVIQLP